MHFRLTFETCSTRSKQILNHLEHMFSIMASLLWSCSYRCSSCSLLAHVLNSGFSPFALLVLDVPLAASCASSPPEGLCWIAVSQKVEQFGTRCRERSCREGGRRTFSNDSPSSNRRGERAQRASEAPRDIHACCVDARAALAALALLLLVVLAPPQSYTLAVLMLLPL